MVHDPETPENLREERIQKEEDEIEMAQQRKKKGAKKKAPLPKEDVSESESETPKPPKNRKSKKKVRIKASPRGYPVGPRGYSVVPVDDLIEDDDTGLRRSKRARTEPLQFGETRELCLAPMMKKGC